MMEIPQRPVRALALAAALLLVPLASQAHGGHAAAGAAPGKAGARPALGSSAAFASDGRLWLAGLDGAGRLALFTSDDEGRRWSAPRVVDTGGERISADGENRPKIAFGPRGQVVLAYTRPLAKPYTGEIRMLRSADGGRTFSAPFTVHRDRQVITHRFESVAFDARGALHVAWVDKRDLEAAKAAGRGGAYRGAAIYRNVSTDGGATFGYELKVADASCECCRIALAPTAEGGMAALWRHVFAPNVRDHAFARLDGGPSTAPAPARAPARGTASPPVAGSVSGDAAVPVEPVRASFDGWAVDACPHHGPGLAAAADGGWHAVWYGRRAGRAAVRYGRLDPSGRPAGEARELPDAGAEHADVGSSGQRVAVVWRSFDGARMRLRAWVSDDGGERFGAPRDLAGTEGDSDHPRLARRGDDLFVIWRTTERIHVERLLP